MKVFCIIAVVATLLVIALSIIKYRILLNMALNARAKNLLSSEKQEVPAREQEIRRQIQEDGEWMMSLPREDIEILSQEGLRLVGHYIPAQGEPRRLVVLFHGWRGSWTGDFGSIGRWLREIGCDLLLPEQRAQGASEGKYMGFGVLERRDVAQWMRYLERERHNTLPVYLGGVSMGAATVLMAAGDPMPEFVKGILADCGFTSPYEMLYEVASKSLHIWEHPAMDYVRLITRLYARFDLREYSTLEALQKTSLPIFFVHGLADDFVPCRMTQQAYEICVSRKELLLVEGASHVRSFFYDNENYRRRAEAFFGWQTDMQERNRDL